MNATLDVNAAVIGYPVEHSLSPAIHNAIYEARGIPWRYGLASCPERADVDELVYDARMKALRADSPGEIPLGFNVTMPYKDAALEIADRPNLSSEIAGCANVLTFAEECDEFMCSMVLGADTTDGEGACRALEHAGARIAGSQVLVLGTGGAARSIAFSTLMNGAGSVTVASRRPDAAKGIFDGMLDRADRASAEGRFLGWGFGSRWRPMKWRRPEGGIRTTGYDGIEAVARACDIIVNATPLGMGEGDPSPIPAGCFREGQTAMDAVYGHGETAFAKAASAAGARTLDGLPMLVEQALATIAIWCDVAGIDFDLDDPANAEALRGAGIIG